MSSKTVETTPKPKPTKSFCFLFFPIWTIWMAQGTVQASHDTWIPLPLIGYLRYEVAIVIFFLIELPVLATCWHAYVVNKGNNSKKSWLAYTILCIALILPFVPDSIRPVFFTETPHSFFQHYQGITGHALPPEKIQVVVEHATGLSVENSTLFAEMAWKHRQEWTHTSKARCLGYFQLGPSINFDRRYAKSRQTRRGWSLKYGFTPMSDTRMSYESHFRLHFPQKRRYVLEEIFQKSDYLLALRDVYARTVGVDSSQVLFGDEVYPGLGIPAVTIMLGNVVWNSLSNVHTDMIYASRFAQKNAGSNEFCKATNDVTSFLLPLTHVPGAGLRYWRNATDMQEVYYQLGHVYTFAATTVHAIRPLPYYEWKRQDVRMTIQAFGVECDDGRWVIYH